MTSLTTGTGYLQLAQHTQLLRHQQIFYDKTINILSYLGTEKLWAHVYLDSRPARPKARIHPVCLFLIRSDRRSDGGLDDLGLVLQARETHSGVEYERLGIFIMRTTDRHKCFGSDMHIVEIV
jgi:hypothetical protein